MSNIQKLHGEILTGLKVKGYFKDSNKFDDRFTQEVIKLAEGVVSISSKFIPDDNKEAILAGLRDFIQQSVEEVKSVKGENLFEQLQTYAWLIKNPELNSSLDIYQAGKELADLAKAEQAVTQKEIDDIDADIEARKAAAEVRRQAEEQERKRAEAEALKIAQEKAKAEKAQSEENARLQAKPASEVETVVQQSQISPSKKGLIKKTIDLDTGASISTPKRTKKKSIESPEVKAARKTQEAEAIRKAQEAEAAIKAQEEAETIRKAQEAEAARHAQEAEATRKEQEAEAIRKAQEAEAAKKAQEEAEATRHAQEAEAARKEQEAEAKTTIKASAAKNQVIHDIISKVDAFEDLSEKDKEIVKANLIANSENGTVIPTDAEINKRIEQVRAVGQLNAICNGALSDLYAEIDAHHELPKAQDAKSQKIQQLANNVMENAADRIAAQKIIFFEAAKEALNDKTLIAKPAERLSNFKDKFAENGHAYQSVIAKHRHEHKEVLRKIGVVLLHLFTAGIPALVSVLATGKVAWWDKKTKSEERANDCQEIVKSRLAPG